MIKIKDKEILLFGINIAGVLFSLSYVILYNMGLMAMQYAEVVNPLEESGIFVFITFGKIFWVVGICVIFGLNVMYILNGVVEYQKEKNKGWL